MIIGDRSAIGSARWKNAVYDPSGHGDSDEFVDSDIPYVVLDTSSPFEGKLPSSRIVVGRVPSDPESGFDEACKYMHNTARFAGKATVADSFALSALEWERVSRINFNPTAPDLYTCPPCSFVKRDNLRLLPNYSSHNLYCFNLHGSSTHDYWVSGDGNPAYFPSQLPSNGSLGYVLGTEACYGAKPVIRKDSANQSVLVSALTNRCLGYIGSTQIAYGIPDSALEHGASPFGADILIGKFVEYVALGSCIGDAYIEALGDLVNSARKGQTCSEEIKTLATFALYGDPSTSLIGKTQKTLKSAPDAPKPTERRSALHIDMPDVRRAVNESLTRVSEKIAAVAQNYIDTYHRYFSDSTPKYYSVSGYDGYKATYSKRADGDGVRILNVYMSRDGKIDKVCVSK
jgi:hypothetical protein